jgi:hypothetical protein
LETFFVKNLHVQKSCPGENHIISFYSRKKLPGMATSKNPGRSDFFADYIIIGMFDRNLKNKFSCKKTCICKKMHIIIFAKLKNKKLCCQPFINEIFWKCFKKKNQFH